MGTRYTCPASAQLLYSGTMAGKSQSESGDGANFLCLPKTPTYMTVPGGLGDGRISAAHYAWASSNTPFQGVNNRVIPCAVCFTDKVNLVMMPGVIQCPTNAWTREYIGYLASEHSSVANNPTSYECIDQKTVTLGALSTGAALYHVRANCGPTLGLPCGPGLYDNTRDLTCAVCTI